MQIKLHDRERTQRGLKGGSLKVLTGYNPANLGREKMVGRYIAHGEIVSLNPGNLLLETLPGPQWRLGVVNPAGHVDWQIGWTEMLGNVLHAARLSLNPEMAR